MIRVRALLFAALAVAGIAAAAGWADAADSPRWWSRGERPHSGLTRWCDAALREASLADIRSVLALRPEQLAAWDRLVGAVQRGAGLACDTKLASGGGAAAELAQAEAAMVRGLEAVREIRPAFDALYTLLGDEQKKTLDTLFARRRRA
jgi:hypothetical protein